MMKRYFLITTLALSAMLAGCGTNKPADVSSETAASTAAATSEYDFAEVSLNYGALPVEDYYDLYFDMNRLLDARFALESELLSCGSLNDKEVYTVKESTDEYAQTYWRVEVDGEPVTWQYYEDRAREIYNEDYVETIFTPYYIGQENSLYIEVDGALYREVADGWTHRMDRDSMQIARYGENYLVWGYIYYFEDMRDTVLYYVKPNLDKPFGMEIEMRTVISADF